MAASYAATGLRRGYRKAVSLGTVLSVLNDDARHLPGEIKQRSSKRGKQPPTAIAKRTRKPLFYRRSRPTDTTHRVPDRLDGAVALG